MNKKDKKLVEMKLLYFYIYWMSFLFENIREVAAYALTD